MNAPVLIALTLFVLIIPTGLLLTWITTRGSPTTAKVNWRHIADMEQEVYGRIMSEQAVQATASLTPKLDSYFHRPAQGLVGRRITGYCRYDDLDPDYEWIRVIRLGDPEPRYIRGPRKDL